MKKMKGLELNLDVAGSKKTWPVILLMYSPKRALFGVGWKEFVKENALKVGDVCVFELVKAARKFNVIIYQ